MSTYALLHYTVAEIHSTTGLGDSRFGEVLFRFGVAAVNIVAETAIIATRAAALLEVEACA